MRKRIPRCITHSDADIIIAGNRFVRDLPEDVLETNLLSRPRSTRSSANTDQTSRHAGR
jgi:hypothetical protein